MFALLKVEKQVRFQPRSLNIIKLGNIEESHIMLVTTVNGRKYAISELGCHLEFFLSQWKKSWTLNSRSRKRSPQKVLKGREPFAEIYNFPWDAFAYSFVSALI